MIYKCTYCNWKPKENEMVKYNKNKEPVCPNCGKWEYIVENAVKAEPHLSCFDKTGRGGKDSACQFEPRYDECYHPCLDTFKINEALKILNDNRPVEELRKIFYYKVYVHDICTKCGKVVKRGE